MNDKKHAEQEKNIDDIICEIEEVVNDMTKTKMFHNTEPTTIGLITGLKLSIDIIKRHKNKN